MYEDNKTVVRCAVGVSCGFKAGVGYMKVNILQKVGLHQTSGLSYFLFTLVMIKLTEEVKQEFLWTMTIFADDIVVCSEGRQRVEESLEKWRYVEEEE